MSNSGNFDGDGVEFSSYPALREVIETLPGVRFRGVMETVGLNVSPLFAYERIRGLFVIPVSSTEASVLVRPDEFVTWIRSALSDVDFSDGCCLWISIERPGHRGFPWIDIELGGVDDLIPLWFELRAQVVMIFSPASYCIVAFFEEENGWEMYRQP